MDGRTDGRMNKSVSRVVMGREQQDVLGEAVGRAIGRSKSGGHGTAV